MIKKITVTFFSDASHGWLRVPRKLVEQLGIADKVSVHSYEKADKVFLEEDCDAPLAFRAMDAQKIKYNIIDKVSSKSSRIRSYSPYIKRS